MAWLCRFDTVIALQLMAGRGAAIDSLKPGESPIGKGALMRNIILRCMAVIAVVLCGLGVAVVFAAPASASTSSTNQPLVLARSAAQSTSSVVADDVSASIAKPLGTSPDGTSWLGINCRDSSKEVNEPYGEVAVPGNYCYAPTTNIHRAWHDYCTKSDDSYGIPFDGTADFRGPCAKHDLCLNFKNGHNYCDPILLHDLDHNCQYTFGSKDPFRYTCETKAHAMYLVIRLING